MKIEVQLHTTLQKQTPQGLQRCIDLEMAEGSTIRDVLQALAARARRPSTCCW